MSALASLTSMAASLSSEDVRKVAVPAAVGLGAALATLYGVGCFAVLSATATPRDGSARPPPPGRQRAGQGLPGDEARSTTSSGVGAPGGGAAVYEASKAVDEYLLFHFGPPELLMPYAFGPRDALDFPARCAALAAKHAPKAEQRRALDVGCAVGGAVFELARSFDHAAGVDFSHAFINAAKRLQKGERLPCTATEEGTLTSWFVASAPEGVDCGRCAFSQGDACALPPASALGGPFHAVVAANLLCRLPRPAAFLESLPRLLAPGGVAVLVSPFSWLAEWTPQPEWLGGCVRGGDSLASAPELAKIMEGLGFSLLEESDQPFLIREHARKFQYGCSNATVWRKGE